MKNVKCFLLGHDVKSKLKRRNEIWGKPYGEPRFYFKCLRCDLKDVVDLPYITTGSIESEKWGIPISIIGRKFSKIKMSKLNHYDKNHTGYHGVFGHTGRYNIETNTNKLIAILKI